MRNPGGRTTASATTTPPLGAYNAQDPLGLAPRLASAQGYVDHAAHWGDVLGLHGCWAAKEVQEKVVYQQTGRRVFNPHKEVYLPREIGGGIGINVDLMRHGRAPHRGRWKPGELAPYRTR